MNSEGLRQETTRLAELIEVIHTESTRGYGKEGDPIRVVDQYWNKEGILLAEHDIMEDNK